MHSGQPTMEQQGSEIDQTIQGLLVRAAAVSGADRVLVISTPDDHGTQTILADSTSAHGDGTDVYEARASDVVTGLDYGGQTIGDLVFANPRPGVDQAIFDAYASAAAFMLGYGSELRDAARTIEESQVLRELGLQLGEPTDLSQMLGSTANGARQLLKADYAAIATVAADGTSRWIAMSGNRTDAYLHTVFPAGKGIAARVVSARRPVALHGIGISPDLPAEEFPVHAAEGEFQLSQCR